MAGNTHTGEQDTRKSEKKKTQNSRKERQQRAPAAKSDPTTPTPPRRRKNPTPEKKQVAKGTKDREPSAERETTAQNQQIQIKRANQNSKTGRTEKTRKRTPNQGCMEQQRAKEEEADRGKADQSKTPAR